MCLFITVPSVYILLEDGRVHASVSLPTGKHHVVQWQRTSCQSQLDLPRCDLPSIKYEMQTSKGQVSVPYTIF